MAPTDPKPAREAELYAPAKLWLTGRGYDALAEVEGPASSQAILMLASPWWG